MSKKSERIGEKVGLGIATQHKHELMGEILASYEGMKFILTEKCPLPIYINWITLSTHYSCMAGFFLKEIIDDKSGKETIEILNESHKRMIELLQLFEKNFKDKKD